MYIYYYLPTSLITMCTNECYMITDCEHILLVTHLDKKKMLIPTRF